MDIETEHTFVWRKIKQGLTFDDMLRKRYPRDLEPMDLNEAYNEIYEKFIERYIKSDILM